MTFCVVEKMKYNVIDENSELNLLIPYKSVNREENINLTGMEILDLNGEVVAKIISNFHNIGLALVEKEKLESCKNPQFKVNVIYSSKHF